MNMILHCYCLYIRFSNYEIIILLSLPMFQGLQELLLSAALKLTMSEVMSGHLERLASGGKQNASSLTSYINAKHKKYITIFPYIYIYLYRTRRWHGREEEKRVLQEESTECFGQAQELNQEESKEEQQQGYGLCHRRPS
jgi:hypothetical protein